MGVFERVEGYDLKECSDAKVFLIDVSTKTIEELTEQPLVVGEDRSQFIRFEIDRYVDGIDLSCTKISMIYANEDGAGDKSKVINVERSEDKLRFGWLVPGLALLKPGTLTFSVKFENDGYILRTRPLDTEIFDTIGENCIPEPVEKEWYIEIQEKCRDVLERAEALTDGVQSVESEEDGGTNVYTFGNGSTLCVKNGKKGSKGDPGERGPQGDTGATGAQGPKGDPGERGATWHVGTDITGTGTGISYYLSGAKIGDLYLNTSTCNVYKCISDSGIWDYTCNIMGGTDGETIEGLAKFRKYKITRSEDKSTVLIDNIEKTDCKIIKEHLENNNGNLVIVSDGRYYAGLTISAGTSYRDSHVILSVFDEFDSRLIGDNCYLLVGDNIVFIQDGYFYGNGEKTFIFDNIEYQEIIITRASSGLAYIENLSKEEVDKIVDYFDKNNGNISIIDKNGVIHKNCFVSYYKEGIGSYTNDTQVTFGTADVSYAEIKSFLFERSKSNALSSVGCLDYPTVETFVGTWVDGSPIYRNYFEVMEKTFEAPSGNMFIESASDDGHRENQSIDVILGHKIGGSYTTPWEQVGYTTKYGLLIFSEPIDVKQIAFGNAPGGTNNHWASSYDLYYSDTDDLSLDNISDLSSFNHVIMDDFYWDVPYMNGNNANYAIQTWEENVKIKRLLIKITGGAIYAIDIKLASDITFPCVDVIENIKIIDAKVFNKSDDNMCFTNYHVYYNKTLENFIVDIEGVYETSDVICSIDYIRKY